MQVRSSNQLAAFCAALITTLTPALGLACSATGSGGSCFGSYLLFGPTSAGTGAIALGLGLVVGIVTAKRRVKL